MNGRIRILAKITEMTNSCILCSWLDPLILQKKEKEKKCSSCKMGNVANAIWVRGAGHSLKSKLIGKVKYLDIYENNGRLRGTADCTSTTPRIATNELVIILGKTREVYFGRQLWLD